MPSKKKAAKVKSAADKRQLNRIDVAEKVELTFNDFRTFTVEYAENLSTGGMYLRTATPVPANSVVSFRLTIRDINRQIAGKAIVVWTKEVFDDDGKGNASGMGLKFIELEGESEAFIKEFVAKYSHL